MAMRSKHMRDKKLKEAVVEMAEGKKALKTTMWKWKADWLTAGNHFAKAAKCFTMGGDPVRAKEAFEYSAQAAGQNGQLYTTAEAFKGAAEATLEIGGDQAMEDAQVYFDKAKDHFLEANAPDPAIAMIAKAARLQLKAHKDDDGIELLLEAVQLIERQNRYVTNMEILSETLNNLVRSCRIRDAIDFLERLEKIYTQLGRQSDVNRTYLSLTVLHCANDDAVAAQALFQDHIQSDAFLHSREIATEEDLIKAFMDNDSNQLAELQKGRGFHYLEPEIGRVAMKLRIGEVLYGSKPAPAPASASASAPAAKSVAAAPAPAAAPVAEASSAPAASDPAMPPVPPESAGASSSAAAPAPATAAPAAAPVPAPAAAMASTVMPGGSDSEDEDGGVDMR